MHKASVEERLKLKRIQIDTWSTREQLCLASSVLRSGDQNWVSVSRSVKVLGDPGRPHDWFSQKNCALQYDSLLENAGTPKRKRGEKGEETKPTTPGECIVQKLTMERVDELKKLLEQQKVRYKKLKEDVMELSSGHADHRLAEINQEIEDEKRQKELDEIAHEKWLKEREEKIIEIQRAFRPQGYLIPRKPIIPPRITGQLDLAATSDPEASQDSPLNESLNIDAPTDDTPIKTSEEKPANTPTSPLLTSLLKSPSPAPSSQRTVAVPNAVSATPTISSLLASSPNKQGIVAGNTFSPNLKHLVTNAIASGDAQVPDEQNKMQQLPTTSQSAGAPTLSKLLELPPSVPGTPLPELPDQTTMPTRSFEEGAKGVEQVQNIVTGTNQVDVTLQAKTDSHVRGELPVSELGILQAVQQGATFTQESIIAAATDNTAKQNQEPNYNVPCVKQEIPGVPQQQLSGINLPPMPPVLDTAIEDTQLDKMVTEMKAEERPSNRAESVLEELPQDVVSLIEEVEMAEEAQKLKQQQLLQHPPPPQQKVDIAKPEEVQMKIQQIQQQLVASVPETVAVEVNQPTVGTEAPFKSEIVTETVKKLEEFTDQSAHEEESPEETVKEPEEVEEIVSEPSVTEETRPEVTTLEVGPVPEDVAEPAKEVVLVASEVDKESEPEKVEASEEAVAAQDLEVIEEAEEEEEPAAPPKAETDVAQSSLHDTPVLSGEEPQDEEEEEEEEEESAAQQLTPSTPITTRRGRNAPPQSTPSTPIDSVPNSPASVGVPGSDEDKEYRNWKKSILLIWSRLAAHKNASIFTKPITNDLAPGYHNIVFRPMDLTTIKRNIESGHIKTTLEFQRDLMLMFANAVMYNASNHEVPKMAREMEVDSILHIQMFKKTQESDNSRLRRETRETNKRHDSFVSGDGNDSEASRSTAPSPLPLKRKRTTTVSTPTVNVKKRRSSFAQ